MIKAYGIRKCGVIRVLPRRAVKLEFTISNRKPVKEFIWEELKGAYSEAHSGSTVGHGLAAASKGLGLLLGAGQLYALCLFGISGHNACES